ncbi:protein FAM151B-like [Plectropomus leopardus]|uniref:protein FAM151B-like n=1 Tax=Plectropomus leopardus TaxID=160734 RepID=UPI001C4CBEDA|nr:protein FAM151B-like [Plectropomus leopardus]
MDRGHIKRRDAAEVRWSHAVNSRGHLTEALAGETHMMEADVIIRGHDPREPVMAHPPDTDSDVTLREWLEEVKEREKGIKLDFKSLEAVSQSVLLLQEVLDHNSCPLWINADILTGPGGQDRPLDPQSFLSAVRTLPPHTVLSLGWTTGSTAGTDNPGYSWDMVHLMEDICRDLKHAVTFPVQAALLSQSLSQLRWLLQQSDRYSLTVWTGQKDEYSLQDLLSYRTEFDVSRIYYDLPESQRTEISLTTQQNTRKSCLLFICL